MAAPGSSLEAIRRHRDELQANLQAVYKGAPRTDKRAYAKAQQALKIDEELMFSDQEIDHFLPGPLKRASGRSERRDPRERHLLRETFTANTAQNNFSMAYTDE